MREGDEGGRGGADGSTWDISREVPSLVEDTSSGVMRVDGFVCVRSVARGFLCPTG